MSLNATFAVQFLAEMPERLPVIVLCSMNIQHGWLKSAFLNESAVPLSENTLLVTTAVEAWLCTPLYAYRTTQYSTTLPLLPSRLIAPQMPGFGLLSADVKVI